MTTRDRMVLIGVIVLVALAGGYLLVVSPERKQAAQAETQVQSAQQQLESARTAAAGAKAAEQRYDAAYSSVVRLGEAVPPATEVPSLIYQLDVASGERDVDFASISTSTSGSGPSSAPSSAASSSAAGGASASATPAGFTQMPFTFVFKGSFEGLAHLLGQVDSFVERTHTGELRVSGRLLTIQGADITIENSSSASGAKVNPFAPTLTATITATAYVLPASQGLTGGATPILPGSPGSASTSSSATTPALIKVTP
jgi:Type II secretion system (T2SS), protein M